MSPYKLSLDIEYREYWSNIEACQRLFKATPIDVLVSRKGFCAGTHRTFRTPLLQNDCSDS